LVLNNTHDLVTMVKMFDKELMQIFKLIPGYRDGSTLLLWCSYIRSLTAAYGNKNYL
jgi:hypothetical protein